MSNVQRSTGWWWRRVAGIASLSLALRAFQWASDRLNPILVKETRQALKSRQFTITFGLLLICGWVWSILGVTLAGRDIWYGAPGADMFYGYFVILAFPLLVIVPFGAFRSLAGEQEDRTYELMSITTLGPRQIVAGKLGSAALQMLIYLSAITPCLAFTYLLRGIDFPTILFFVFYAILFSLGLAAVGLLAGTVTSEKHWQVVLSVFLIAGLLAAFLGSLTLVGELLSELRGAFTNAEFWQGNAAFLTGYLSYVVLLFYAAAAQITFASDNRSTRLRVVMVLQHLLLTGWLAWVWIMDPSVADYVLVTYMILIGLHWYVMGMFMTGESPQLSPRVRRQLPQSFLGRVFLTWFNPGPGTGYVLVISSLLGALAMVLLAVVVKESFGLFRPPMGVRIPMGFRIDARQMLTFGVLGLSYVTVYLGVGLLLTRLLRCIVRVEILLTVLLQCLLTLVGLFVPWVVQSMWLRDPDYFRFTWTRVPDPLCSLTHVMGRSGLPPEALVLLVVVPGFALLILLLNLPAVAREVQQVRIAKPQRVAEEDAELAAQKAPHTPARTSPWD
jgi:hypothetical protein